MHRASSVLVNQPEQDHSASVSSPRCRHIRTSFKARSARPLAALLTAIVLLFFAGSSFATASYCVNSAQELIDDFHNAATIAPEGETVDIRIEGKVLALNQSLSFVTLGNRDGKNVKVSGSWNFDCTAQDVTPSTVIAFPATGGPYEFSIEGRQSSITVERIKVTGNVDVLLDDAACQFGCPFTSDVTIKYNHFDVRTFFVSFTQAQNLLVTTNVIETTGNRIYFEESFDGGIGTAFVTYNTMRVFGSSSCTSAGGASFAVKLDIVGAQLHHNAVKSDCANDVVGFAENLGVYHNAYEAIVFNTNTQGLNVGNVITADPGFVNENGGDYHLAAASPAINAGMSQPTQYPGITVSFPPRDLDGPIGLRKIGSKMDIGAYESSIDDSSTLIVTSLADSGTGTLRNAVTSANVTAGSQTIKFNIPGSCPRVIVLDTPLPDVTDSVAIEGYTQPGSFPNELVHGNNAGICVVLTPPLGGFSHALNVPATADSTVALEVRGVAFAFFSTPIRLLGGSGHAIQGNAIGGTGPGLVGVLGSPVNGLQIGGSAKDVLVGGLAPEDRNTFGRAFNGILILGPNTSGHFIANNYFGLAPHGDQLEANAGSGIQSAGSPNVTVHGNVIAASGSAGIFVSLASATGWKVVRNLIGTSKPSSGLAPEATGNAQGIRISSGSSNHIIGGTTAASLVSDANTIVNNEGPGVWIDGDTSFGVAVRGNHMRNNGHAGAGLGVDLGIAGRAPTDALDEDGGANRLMNAPTFSGVRPGPDEINISGFLISEPNTDYQIDFYRGDQCFLDADLGDGGEYDERGGDGYEWLGSALVTAGSFGAAEFDVTLPMSQFAGYLVAMATHVPTGSTSETSECQLVNDEILSDGFEN